MTPSQSGPSNTVLNEHFEEDFEKVLINGNGNSHLRVWLLGELVVTMSDIFEFRQ